MTRFSSLSAYRVRVVRDVFGGPVDDDDAMLLMAILHAYGFELPGAILGDVEGTGPVAALTQRGAAEVVADLWRDGTDARRDPYHWYWAWNGAWGSYDRLAALSDAERARIEAMIARLEAHPAVGRLVPEDFELRPRRP